MRKIICLLFILLLPALSCACGIRPIGFMDATPTITESVAAKSGDETEKNIATMSETVDLDLTTMSGTVVYSQVYNMMSNPTKYVGKTVKIKGAFSAYYSNSTKLYYPAVIIADARACCSQGMEFVLDGNPAYPAGYPESGNEITVIGTFETYYEGMSLYCHLVQAKMV